MLITIIVIIMIHNNHMITQADGQEMMTDYHNWLSTSLDIDKINLDAYVLHI